MALQKICSTCKKWKDKSEFYNSKFSKDGLHNSCKNCSSKSAKRSWRFIKEGRKSSGLCVYCGRKNDGKYSRCSICREKSRVYIRSFYHKRISKGLCGYCGKRELFTKTACERCSHNYHREKENFPEKMMLRHIRGVAKKKGLEFDLDVSDIHIPETCPLLEVPLEIGLSIKGDYSPSVDRIDPKRGYVKGNVWVISDKANRMKNNATLEEIAILAKNIHKILSVN